MFDFANYTYSGLLSIIVALFSFAYPKITESFEKVDEKYKSSMLSARMQRETSFVLFQVLLVINLFYNILLPFVIDQLTNGRWFIMAQAVGVVALVTSTFCLFYTRMIYDKASKLQNEIWADFKEAKAKHKKEAERLYFSEWVDLACYTMAGADRTTAKSIYDCCSDYIASFVKENEGNNYEFDGYYYEGLSKLNDCICKYPDEPISVNNGNPLLCSLITPYFGITESTYVSLRRNLMLQLHYGKDEWIKSYWTQASQRYNLFMKKLSTFYLNEETGTYYTEEEVKERDKDRWRFYEFHLMLCALIMQNRRYDLLRDILSFTQSFPPSYPLIPSTMQECMHLFHEMGKRYSYNTIELEKKYPMLNSHGIVDDKIMGAVNKYIALMVLRVYTLMWPYGSEHALGSPYGAENLKDNASWISDMETLKRCLDIVRSDKDLLNAIGISVWTKTFEIAKKQYGDILEPDVIIDQFIESLNKKMKEEREDVRYDDDRVAGMKNEIDTILTKSLSSYEDFITDRKFPSKNSYFINGSVFNIFPNAAFVKDRDIDYVNIPETMADGMIMPFKHYFSSVFVRETPVGAFSVDSEDVFNAIDSLKLTEKHIIISFGIYWDYYVDKVENLSKDGDNYKYGNIRILNLNSGSSLLYQCFYVMKAEDMPYLIFQDPSEEWQATFKPEPKNEKYHLWLSLQKIKEHPEMLNEEDRKRMTENPNEMSIFAGMLLAQMHWKKNCPTIKINVKYKLLDNGNVDDVSKIGTFASYEQKANQPNKAIVLSDVEWRIMEKLGSGNKTTLDGLSSSLKVKPYIISKAIVSLKNNQLLTRVGSPRSGHWEVVKDWKTKCNKK